MNRVRLLVCFSLVMVFGRHPVLGDFSDNFDTYAAGAAPGGTWVDFGGSQPLVISTTQAHSGANSLRLSEGTDTLGNSSTGYGSDVFTNLGLTTPLTSGQHTLSYWQFIEPGVDSVAFGFFTSGLLPATFETGVDLRAATFDAFGVGTGMLVVQDIGNPPSATLVAAPVPLVTGAWAEIKYEIDLGTNLYNFSYNGTQMVTGLQWDTNPANGASLGGINLWMQLGNTNGTNSFVYYDDFQLVSVPEPAGSTPWIVALSGAVLFRRRAT